MSGNNNNNNNSKLKFVSIKNASTTTTTNSTNTSLLYKIKQELVEEEKQQKNDHGLLYSTHSSSVGVINNFNNGNIVGASASSIFDREELAIIHELPEFFLFHTKTLPTDSTYKKVEFGELQGRVEFSNTTPNRFAYLAKHSAFASNDKQTFSHALTTISSLKNRNKTYIIADLPPIIPGLFQQVNMKGTIPPKKKGGYDQYAVSPNLYVYEYELIHNDKTQSMLDAKLPFGKDKILTQCIPFGHLVLLCFQVFRLPDSPVKKPAFDSNTLERIFRNVATPCCKTHFESLPVDQKPNGIEIYIKRMQANLVANVDPFKIDDVVEEFPITTQCLENELRKIAPNIHEMFYRDASVKMYLYTRQWNILSTYYPFEILGAGLSSVEFLQLFEKITNDPISLCFNQSITIEYLTEMNIPDNEPMRIKRKLPELKMQHANHLCNKGQSFTVKDVDMVKLVLYTTLKELIDKEKHTYIDFFTLFDACLKTCKNYNLDERISKYPDWLDRVIELSDQHIFHLTTKDRFKARIYLFEMYKHEVIIGKARAFLFNKSNALKENGRNPACVRKEIWENRKQFITTLKSNRGHLLCDEQQAVLNSFMEKDVTVLKGPAGSGKTDCLQSIPYILEKTNVDTAAGFIDFLKSIGENSQEFVNQAKFAPVADVDEANLNKIYPGAGGEALNKNLERCSSSILATSVQGNNAADLNFLFRGNASTTHALLLKHYRLCPHHGLRGLQMSEDDKKTAKCPFDQIRVLLIEECSLYVPELAAKILGILVLCAKDFEKLLLVGDDGQLPSVSPGDFLRSMIKACNTITFTHDHRTDPSASLLKHNNDAIRAGRFQDLKFDGKIAILREIPYQEHAETSLEEWQIIKIMEELIRMYDMTIYNSHVIARTNKVKDVLESILRKHYWQKHARLAQDNEPLRYGFYRGFKIAFGKSMEHVISNRIYIIMDIFDFNVSSDKQTTFVTYQQQGNNNNSNNKKRSFNNLDDDATDNYGEFSMTSSSSKQQPYNKYQRTGFYNSKGSSTTSSSSNNNVYQQQSISHKREIQYVNHTSDHQPNWRDWRRYMLLYEISSFSPKLADTSLAKNPNATPQTIEEKLNRELLRFFNQFQNPETGKASADMVKGSDRYPNIQDPEQVFTVIKCDKEILDNTFSAFVTTVNKFQGSQVTQINDWIITKSVYDTREVKYTSTTRGQKRTITVGNRKNIDEAIERLDPPRNTGLAEEVKKATLTTVNSSSSLDSSSLLNNNNKQQ